MIKGAAAPFYLPQIIRVLARKGATSVKFGKRELG